MGYQTGVIDALRDWGLTVRESVGWRTRGASDFDPRGHVCHHDVIGDQAGTHDTVPSLIIWGRSDLPGPLANFWLERDGDVHLVAAGRANHAGEGGWRGLSGNSSVWGTEANNLGTPDDPWPEAQLEAWHRLCAATCEFSGFSPAMVCGHKEWAPSRKIDPHSLDMDGFRLLVGTQTKEGFSIMDKATRRYFDEKFRLVKQRQLNTLEHVRAVRRNQGETDAQLRDIDRDIKALSDELKAELAET